MKTFKWDEAKNDLLKQQPDRQITFEEIVEAINQGDLLDIIRHPNREKYPHQKIFIVKINNYAYCVPFVEEDESTFFLKTIFPNRKMTEKYLGS